VAKPSKTWRRCAEHAGCRECHKLLQLRGPKKRMLDLYMDGHLELGRRAMTGSFGTGPVMCISITVANTVPDEAFARVVALANLLRESDTNFDGVPIQVARGATTNVAVTDPEDSMRENLLRLLVEEALKAEPDSLLGSLC
jgi:hypothetical protein